MSKLIALAAVVGAVVFAGAAHAATASKLSGVVVSKEAARHTLVVASSHGTVTTVRATAHQFRTTPRGSRISATGTTLADGSLHATRLTRIGKARTARLNVTVLNASGAKLLVAGGGSAFALRLSSSAQARAAAHSGPKPGDRIDAEVKLSHRGLVGGEVQTTGTSVIIDFSGKVTAMDATSLTILSDGVSTVVAIPDGVTLPQLVQVGSEVEIVASVSGTTLTLVEIKIDSDGGDGGGWHGGDSGFHVEGFVTSLDAGSITIQPGDNASPVTLAIPDGFTLPTGLAAGSKVEAEGSLVNGVLTLTKLRLKTGDGDSGEVETEGTVTALDTGSITIQPAESGTPLTFAIPDGFTLPDGLQVGSLVFAKGEMVSSVLTLTKLRLHESDNGEVEAEGTVSALDAGSVTIQTEDSSVTFTIPDGFTLPDGLQVGSSVEARGAYASGVLTLTKIELQNGGDG
jgi:Domain of unknown function (DUF5666)